MIFFLVCFWSSQSFILNISDFLSCNWQSFSLVFCLESHLSVVFEISCLDFRLRNVIPSKMHSPEQSVVCSTHWDVFFVSCSDWWISRDQPRCPFHYRRPHLRTYLLRSKHPPSQHPPGCLQLLHQWWIKSNWGFWYHHRHPGINETLRPKSIL